MASYPLSQVLDLKKKRVDDALKVVKEKTAALEAEEKKLAEAEKIRDKAKAVYDDKLKQIRHALDTGENTVKLRQMRDYLKLVKEDLQKEEEKVKQQKKQVEIAEAQLDLAKRDLKEKRKDLEKIEMHKELWQQEQKKEEIRKEGHETDELGTISHLFHKQKKPRKK
jgi:flagellar biosynthesis chaperone FliJ